MQGWLDPAGPKPAAVYWTRRVVVLLVAVLLVALVVFLVDRLRGPETTGSASVPSTESTSAAQDPTPAAGQESASTEPQPSPEPAPLEPCTGTALGVRVDGPNPHTRTIPAGFTMTLTTNQPACTLDLAAVKATLTVTSGSDRIWSTADCPDWQPQGQLTITRQEPATFGVQWPIARSNGCELVGTPLGTGTYVASVDVAGATGQFVVLLQE